MHPNRHVRSQQRRSLRRIRQTDAYAFFDLLTDDATLAQVESLLPAHRERLLPPTETLAMFMAQALNAKNGVRFTYASLNCGLQRPGPAEKVSGTISEP